MRQNIYNRYNDTQMERQSFSKNSKMRAYQNMQIHKKWKIDKFYEKYILFSIYIEKVKRISN